MQIKLLSQLLVLPSTYLTSLFPTVSLYLITVSVMTGAAVITADVRRLETIALIVYQYGAATVWITNVVGMHLLWGIWRPLTTKLPTFPQINWQVRHHQIPVNLRSEPLILPSSFLTTFSMTLDWIQSQVATRQTHPSPRFPRPYNFLSFLIFIWCPTRLSDKTRTLLLCWNYWRMAMVKLSIGRWIHSLSPLAKLRRSLC